MRYKIVIGFLLIVLLQLPAHAATGPLPPLVMQGKYTVAWNGITIGRIFLTAREDAKTYQMSLDTKTKGIAALFSRERRVAEVTGQLGEDGQYLPARFSSRPQESDKEDYTLLTYDAEGQLMSRTRVPDDDPSWRAPVAFTQANQGTDPLTGGFILRRKLAAALAQHATAISTKTYDGARLAELTLTIEETPVALTIMNKEIDAIRTRVSRQPIAGYTPKELKKFAAGDPPTALYFSADANHLPLQVSIDVFAGTLTATLEELN